MIYLNIVDYAFLGHINIGVKYSPTLLIINLCQEYR